MSCLGSLHLIQFPRWALFGEGSNLIRRLSRLVEPHGCGIVPLIARRLDCGKALCARCLRLLSFSKLHLRHPQPNVWMILGSFL